MDSLVNSVFSYHKVKAMQDWRTRNKSRLQMATFVLEGLGAFALYWALSSEQAVVAAVIFAIIALGMGAVIWLD